MWRLKGIKFLSQEWLRGLSDREDGSHRGMSLPGTAITACPLMRNNLSLNSITKKNTTIPSSWTHTLTQSDGRCRNIYVGCRHRLWRCLCLRAGTQKQTGRRGNKLLVGNDSNKLIPGMTSPHTQRYTQRHTLGNMHGQPVSNADVMCFDCLPLRADVFLRLCVRALIWGCNRTM